MLCLCSAVLLSCCFCCCCCGLMLYHVQVIQDSQPGPNGEARPFYEYLESCLRHKAESVIFEVRCLADVHVLMTVNCCLCVLRGSVCMLGKGHSSFGQQLPVAQGGVCDLRGALHGLVCALLTCSMVYVFGERYCVHGGQGPSSFHQLPAA
jgi:hypothetical protein